MGMRTAPSAKQVSRYLLEECFFVMVLACDHSVINDITDGCFARLSRGEKVWSADFDTCLAAQRLRLGVIDSIQKQRARRGVRGR